MNKELRRVSVVALSMFLALFVSTSVIQVFAVESLAANPNNRRTVLESYSAQRGPILVDGVAVAESQPVDNQYKFLRTYSQPEPYSAITGYFTLNQGMTGIEGALNEFLSGQANEQFLDQLNALVTGQQPRGGAVELTVDPVVQQAAWDAMAGLSGAVVALDPATGDILALVSTPGYDPNRLSSHDTGSVLEAYDALISDPGEPLKNRAIGGDLYFPGSVFKILVAAAAIDSGAFEPDSAFPNPPTLQLPQSTAVIENASRGPCGPGETVTIAEALRLSCNIPFAELGLELGEETLAEYAEAFGFGESIEIPMASTPSTFPTGLDDAQLMLSSFGQFDVRVTPLQVAMISAAVANGGNLMKPTLVESILAPDLSTVRASEPTLLGQPISGSTAATLTDLLVAGVENGAASNARIDGVDVAGKTGTAENGADAPFTLWFTGFAPADDPQVAIAVVVEDGGGQGQSGSGNEIAAPIAKQVLEAVLNR